jgi:hypothetical protein
MVTHVQNVAQNKAVSDDYIMSILDCVNDKLSEIKFSDSDNGDNKNVVIKVAHQTLNKVMGRQLQ